MTSNDTPVSQAALRAAEALMSEIRECPVLLPDAHVAVQAFARFEAAPNTRPPNTTGLSGEALEQIAKDMEYAVAGGMSWIDHSEATEFCRRIRAVVALSSSNEAATTSAGLAVEIDNGGDATIIWPDGRWLDATPSGKITVGRSPAQESARQYELDALSATPAPIQPDLPEARRALVERIAAWREHFEGMKKRIWLDSDNKRGIINLLRDLEGVLAAPIQGEREAIETARAIVEADLEEAKGMCDADWIGQSQSALDALDAILAIRPLSGDQP